MADVKITVRLQKEGAKRDVGDVRRELKKLGKDAQKAGGSFSAGFSGQLKGAGKRFGLSGGSGGIKNAAGVAAGNLASEAILKVLSLILGAIKRIPGVGEALADVQAGDAAEAKVGQIAGAARAAGSPLSDEEIKALLRELIEIEKRRGEGEARVNTLRIAVEANRVGKALGIQGR